MWPVVLVLLVRFYVGEGIPEIRIFLRQHDSEIACPADDVIAPKLTLNKPFRLSVRSNVTISKGTCSSPTTNKTHVQSFRKEDDYYVPNENLIVRSALINPIVCVFYTKSDKVLCNFTVDVRDLSFGHLAVNGITVPNLTSETDYFDSFGVYGYYEGEPVNVTCHNLKNPLYSQLLYTNVYGTIPTSVQLMQSVNGTLPMYIKLTADDDDSYVDCIFKKYDNTRSLITRVYFKRLTHTLQVLGFKVNGLTQAVINPSDCNQRFCYKYQYYDGEILTIESFKNEERYGDIIYCKIEAENGYSLPKELDYIHERQTNVLITTTVDEKLKKITLICEVEVKDALPHKVAQMSLVLEPNTAANYSPIINGLSMANISAMYKTFTKDYTVNYTLIHYEYDRKLTLECYSSTSGVKWDYNKSEVEEVLPKNLAEMERDMSSYEDSMNYFIITGNFRLKNDCYSSVIKCISPKDLQADSRRKEITVIILRRKRKGAILKNALENNPRLSDNSNPSVLPPGTSSQQTEGDPTKKVILFGAGFGTLVLVIIVIFFIIKVTKKPRVSNQNPTDINYVNLPEGKGQIHTPAQCQDIYAAPTDHVNLTAHHLTPASEYAQPYTAKNVEELYSKPVPKNQREFENQAFAIAESQRKYVNQANTSAESQRKYENEANTAEPTYAEPLSKIKYGGQGIRVLPSDLIRTGLKSTKHNAKIKPKEESPYEEVSQPESPYAEVSKPESPYAEVSKSESPCTEVSQPERPYAEVSKQESPYAEPNCSVPKNYANVFESRRYVNANSSSKDDFAEPAYCEVAKINK